MNNDSLIIDRISELSAEHEAAPSSTNHEMLRVFDSNGNHVGNATRLLCHRLGLWHEVAQCFFLNKNSQILLQMRREEQTETFDISVRGHVGFEDHSPIDTVIREANEELGLIVDRKRLVRLDTYNRKNYTNIKKPREVNNEIRHLFTYVLNENEERSIKKLFLKGGTSEVRGIRWFYVHDAIETISHGLAYDGLQMSLYYLMKSVVLQESSILSGGVHVQRQKSA